MNDSGVNYFGRFLGSGIFIIIFTVLFFLFNFPPISYALLIGILLIMGMLPFGPIGGVLGVLLCAVGGGILWGLGGALLLGGITLNYFSILLRGSTEMGAPLITHLATFRIVTGPAALLVALVGIVVLLAGCFR